MWGGGGWAAFIFINIFFVLISFRWYAGSVINIAYLSAARLWIFSFDLLLSLGLCDDQCGDGLAVDACESHCLC